jgi:hypothetical protein
MKHLPAVSLPTADRLPQPYRLIDKCVSHIVEKVLEEVDKLELCRRQEARKQVRQARIIRLCRIPQCCRWHPYRCTRGVYSTSLANLHALGLTASQCFCEGWHNHAKACIMMHQPAVLQPYESSL